MGRTKKVGTTGRFGVRYGLRSKVTLRKIEKEQKQKYQCPSCKKMKLKRVAAGIWKCKGCKAKMTGGAYVPRSERVDK
ncbi:MAG: 50S ribosomal protein L37ae [Candidatus Aenigmarchaeota archaeon CG_4_10_14_0_8_um_filter_37_24]|nr:50S ribosomal protein L37Ae [Candidatus Aenigmarchaeota archaeon]OIN88519.1 MAG: 50S ribosomal protein L37ae [Candidatus Aenigmarchaeota archaeon CG1_02_38_14]PIV68858.1 MAG: 50S ribosomal protein L37ae [Candidatus Aenigmarchaeota archaeon CG01_land_8_20_14_3_00_37_9]PIW41095.1 MAG: 50S ribosomal protein L37ae [Candidatus Aenigmarchaeota archaeon CG15_BIG_FIL_POST_REV_8_21_14_020_37_27]PIX50944.1 MAG: 50S ribosomal protein L37ae [Candidatus Aenigmarchaeota archaeon CG_4_8_14_3_um_filter_37_2